MIEDLEYAVLGIFILYEEKQADIFSIPEEVFNDTNQKIFLAMKELISKGIKIDLMTLSSHLQDRKIFDQIGGYHELMEMTKNISMSDADNLQSYTKQLSDRYGNRRLISLSYEAAKKAEVGQDFLENISFIEKGVSDLLKIGGERYQLITPEQYIERRLQVLEEREKRGTFSTSYENLDTHLLGFSRKEVSVMAARPSIGKSICKTNLIKQLCRQKIVENGEERQIGVLSVATEQTLETEMDRMSSIVSGIPLWEIMRSNEWEEHDKRRDLLRISEQQISSWNYNLLVSRGLTINSVWFKIKMLKSLGRKIDFVVIDLFDKLEDVNVSTQKATNVGNRLGLVNKIAEEEDIHFMLLVQISREIRHIKDRRPEIWHIKDSGSYEEVARLIFLLHREKYYNPEIIQNILEINIAKQSNGPAGKSVVAKFTLDEKNGLMIPFIERVFE